MFRAFRVEVEKGLEIFIKSSSVLNLFDEKFVDLMSTYAQSSTTKKEEQLFEMLRSASLGTDVLGAEHLWDKWFPEIQADVFISHSSRDCALAKKFKSWLKLNLGLEGFVDSDIWKHADSLLNRLDKEYCYNAKNGTYIYEKRNGSTAHVHMMLSYALTRMIDKTECFVFLETPNSVTITDSVRETYSPWIFHELAMVDTIQVREPERPLLKEASESIKNFSGRELQIGYPLFGQRMQKVDLRSLQEWQSSKQREKAALDYLYREFPVKPPMEV